MLITKAPSRRVVRRVTATTGMPGVGRTPPHHPPLQRVTEDRSERQVRRVTAPTVHATADRTPASPRSPEKEGPRTEQKYPCRRAPSASRAPGGARSSSRRRRCRDALVDAQRVLALEKRRLRSGPEDAGGCARAAETDGDVFGEPGRKAEGEGADERV